MSTGWEALVDLARREEALVKAGRLEELRGLWAERERLTAALGDPPASARDSLVLAGEIVAGTQEALRRALAEARVEGDQVRRGRRVAAGYGGPATPALDLHG